MSAITTHILDLAQGQPAAGVQVELSILRGSNFDKLGAGQTDADGRSRTLLAADSLLAAGTYKIRFETAAYFAAQGKRGFYPFVEIVFEVGDSAAHYHVPLLLSPFGYSTYRGS